MQDNYRTIERKLANRENFRGNSMSAYWLGSTQYAVFSYSSLIAEIDLATGFIGERETARRSTTTSRHRNIVKRAWGLN